MRKHLTLGLILTSAMALTTLAAATSPGDGPRGDHGHRHAHGPMRALRQLHLSDAQRASIRQIMQTRLANAKPQREALRQQHQAFDAMTPDQIGYQAAAAQLAQAESDAARSRVQQQAAMRAQIYAVLNPAQKAQLATLQAQRQARRQQWQQFKAQHPVTPAATGATQAG
jgi:protein CpxP